METEVEESSERVMLSAKLVREYVENRRSFQVVHTSITRSGQVWDWVPIESQVANGTIASPPPPIERDGSAALVLSELESEPQARGPKGTVPILRRPVEGMSVRSALTALTKAPPPDSGAAPNGVGTVAGGWYHAALKRGITNYGGEGFLNMWSPNIHQHYDHSLSQIYVGRGAGVGLQTIEAGWIVQPVRGDYLTHFFTFFTTNGYQSFGNYIGGYDRDYAGWVQVSPMIAPGAVVQVSLFGGFQAEAPVRVQFYAGNWWISWNYEWVGYYPGSLFSTTGLRNVAAEVSFWGEVYDSNQGVNGVTATDMGSSFWPNQGYGYAAYMRNLRYQYNTAGNLADLTGPGIYEANRNCYQIWYYQTTGSWRTHAYFGGPGKNWPYCP